MEELSLQSQIDKLNRKLDILLESALTLQKKNEVIDDFIDDAYRVGIDAFKTSVKEFDENSVQLNTDEVKILFFKLLKNIETFNTLISLLESTVDFIKDATPLAREMIIDLSYQLDKLDKNQTIPSIKAILKNFSQPEFLQSIANISTAVATVKPDKNLDNISLFKLFKMLNSSEVKSSLAYMLRILQNINTCNTTQK
jgi:uncharacterized protein YjgD (DUF1641 family)